MKFNEFNGWQRLLFLLSILYLIAIIIYAWSDFPKDPIGINTKILNTFIENNRELIEKKRIKNALSSLEDYLNIRTKDGFDDLLLAGSGFKTYADGTWRYITFDKQGTVRYPIDVGTTEIIKSLEDRYNENLVIPTVKEIKSKYSNSDSLAIELYQNINSYLASDDFRKEYSSRIYITAFRFLFAHFLLWIIPVIVVYIFGWSIGWVIGGFKKE